MSTIDLNHVVSMNNVSVMNSNFDIIEQAVNGDLVHISGGQNVLKQDLDLDSNDLLNVGTLGAQAISIGGVFIVPSQTATISAAILAQLLHNPPPIGDVAPAYGNFSPLISNNLSVSGGSLTNVTVSATTLAASSTTQSTSTSTGAITTAGGLGVAKDIYCGGSYHGAAFVTAGSINSTPIGATTPSTGTFTTLAASSMDATPIGTTTPALGKFTNLSASGTVSGIPGRLLAIKVFTSSGSYTATSGTNLAIIEVQGGGGGGGGSAATGASQSSVGGGGNAGAYAKVYLASPGPQTVTVGLAGTAGAIGTVGGAGGASSFGTLVSCPGGTGGTAGVTLGSATIYGQGVATAAPTLSGVTSIESQAGMAAVPSYVLAVGTGQSGAGAISAKGTGGQGRGGNAAGVVGNGYGSGGGGGATLSASTAGNTGGAGAPGLVVIYEYA